MIVQARELWRGQNVNFSIYSAINTHLLWLSRRPSVGTGFEKCKVGKEQLFLR